MTGAIRILALSLLLSACATGPQYVPYSGPANNEIFELEDKLGTEIYEGSRQWIAENFKSAKAVIEYESKDTLTIIGNGRSVGTVACVSWGVIKLEYDSTCMHPASMGFTLKVEAKDGRMRLSVPNVYLFRAAYANQGRVIPGSQLEVDQEAYELLSKRILRYGDDIVAYVSQASSSDF